MKPASLLIIAALILWVCFPQAGALLLEVTVTGTVATLSPGSNTITLGHPQQYGCSYAGSALPVCTYKPMKVEPLTGTASDSATFSVFKPGDTVVATSLGGPGENWVSLAKLYGSRPNEEDVTALEGNPSLIPAPLIVGYAVEAIMTANCSACTERICTAASSEVKLLNNDMLVEEHTLLPGQDLHFNGKNDGSVISVLFRNGETSGVECGSTTGTGRQAISVFSITVIPPVGFGQINIRTPTATGTLEVLPSLVELQPIVQNTPGTAAATATLAPRPTTKSGMQPLAAIGAAGLLGLCW